MNPIDVVIILIVGIIVGGASYYIYKAKKSGKNILQNHCAQAEYQAKHLISLFSVH